MRKRTKAREHALKILYQAELMRRSVDLVSKNYWDDLGIYDRTVRNFSDRLTNGISTVIGEIDGIISHHATNWQLKRMAVIDRNVMRLAAYEILYAEDIPSKVSINEAVELAKKYGDTESGKFVNGILDKIHKTEESKYERKPDSA
jgi:transcription antitermination factor NusB